MRFPALAFIAIAAITASSQPANLAFRSAGNESYSFDTGVLRGTLRSEGRSVGLMHLEHIPTVTLLEGNNYGICAHYRVFTANKRYGGGAWDWPSTSTLRADGAVEIHWG